MNNNDYSKRAKGGFQDNPQNINRKGRPKGISITDMVKEALEEVEPKTGKHWKDLIIKRILLKATNEGDTQMLKAIWAYIDGLPQQNHQLTGKDGEALQVVIKDYTIDDEDRDYTSGETKRSS